jgi:dienelactone hydrolase
MARMIAGLCACTAVALGFLPGAFAWPGFSWDAWREATGVSKPELDSPQAGHAELLPLLKEDFGGETVTSVEAWEAKREGILAVLRGFIGSPGAIAAPAPEAVELGREDAGSYTRIHLRIPSEADDTIPAYLLRPKQPAEEKGPVMIVLHQTQGPGKREACGMTGDADMAFADALARRGITCIAPDAIGFGERIPEGAAPYTDSMGFYRKHPNWSFFGKMGWDIARVIDYLETLPYVDATRIGVIGHSHGAYGAIMASVFEPRIGVVAASCGFTTLRTDPAPNRWSHLTALLPRVGFYVDDIRQIPFDWHEIIACIAPRPYFNWATLDDTIFPNTANLAEVYRQVGEVYDLYGRPAAFVGGLAPGAHRFPPEARQEAYEWIEQQFAGSRAGD